MASTVKVLDTVDSTNSLIARAIAASEYADARQCVRHLFEQPDKDAARTATLDPTTEKIPEALPISIAISDMQTKCRGRQGRSWFNQPGESLLSSWAVPVGRNLLDSRYSGWLTTICGLALVDAVNEVLRAHDLHAMNPDSQLKLKWPNDVFCEGHKLAGILCEMVPCNEESAVLIIGIGMNLFVAKEELPIDMSTSLQLQFGPLPAYAELRDELVCATTQHLRKEFSVFMADPAIAVPKLLERVRQMSWTLGKQVQAHLAGDKQLIGRALSINDDASLTILRHDGSQQKVTTADVGVLPDVGL
ncbi:MAG: biotin--[acetyl-CoA-carboxylase] ligase [Bifidobacterium aquikefiri]|uniref:biotin--[acetyl-CoA-carboxylase] ligase n=1 Tax=Bifidobacterium aquikefiri TaxID=1653207 RepID=UPI001302F9B9|nr:biotin--[acetyl-CoA-carboxylase] ligase [Bifidobacterium aquikefiri]